MSKKMSFAKLGASLIFLTFVSKTLGLVRELIMAYVYGAGEIVDAFVMAVSIPDNLFAPIIQFVGAAFLPLYSHYVAEKGEDCSNPYVNKVYNMLMLFSGAVVVILVGFSKQFVTIFAPGFTESLAELTSFYLRISAFLLIGNVGITIFEPYLRYKSSYITPVLFGFAQSISVIVFIFISIVINEYWLIVGVVAGYIIRGFGMQLYSSKYGYRYSLDFRFQGVFRDFVLFSLPILLGSIAGRINVFIDRMLASNFTSGTLSAMNYGHLISDMAGMFSYTIVSTIVYPLIVQAVSLKNNTSAKKWIEDGLNLTILMTVPLAIGGFIYNRELISIIYERGVFDMVAAQETSGIFKWYIIGLPFHGFVLLVAQCFYAHKDTVSAVISSVCSIVVNIIFNFILSKILGAPGLALATTIATMVHSVVLYFAMKKKLGYLNIVISIKKVFEVSIYSIISVGLGWSIYKIITGFISVNIAFVGAAAISAGLYYVILKVRKVGELGLIITGLRKQ